MMHDSSRRSVSGPRAPHRRGLRSTGLLVALLAMHGGAAQAQTPAPAPPPYTLRVTAQDGSINVALTADGVRLSALAADLSKRLGAPVTLGPSLAEETLSVSVLESPLEQALTSFAPRAIVDYVIRQDAHPIPQHIYLLGVTDPDPSRSSVIRGPSEGLLITGHTEDSTTPSADDPLKVMGDGRALTISSKQQPLGVVAVAIGEVLGVPVERKFEATQLIDADIRDSPAEEAIARLSPNIAAYVRVDVNRSERTLLKILVAPPGAR